MLRRNLLLGAGLCSFLPTTQVGAQSSFRLGQKWDVIIVGSGLAGLSASISAKENGADNVLVIEKLPILGGHSRVASGSFCGVSPKRLLPHGINTSIEDAVEECIRVGGPGANRELLTILMSQSESAMDWLEGMGVQWTQPYLPVGSESIYSFANKHGGPGIDYILKVNQRARELNVNFLMGHPVTDLLFNSEKTQVTGVVAKDDNGNIHYIHAPSVILATGGYCGNLSLCRTLSPDVKPNMRTTANPNGRGLDGAQGDAFSLTTPLKAKFVDLEHIQLICYLGGRLLNYVGADIYVNSRGKRFVNEGASHDTVRKALMKEPHNSLWAITDSKSRKAISLENKLLDHSVVKFETLSEVAKYVGCPESDLTETLARYNGFVRSGKDLDFGKKRMIQTIDQPPYYVGLESLGIHYCCGGLAFDEKARVINTSQEPIEGLYAAGEVTGGMHGKDRLGGAALLECVVFGRIAGQEAAFGTRLSSS